ncbi:MAG: hypothetical protein F8N37_11925 [Telmatospirillum sp.]|nr:hypothetical protein [Telmatospirillum sp.]
MFSKTLSALVLCGSLVGGAAFAQTQGSTPASAPSGTPAPAASAASQSGLSQGGATTGNSAGSTTGTAAVPATKDQSAVTAHVGSQSHKATKTASTHSKHGHKHSASPANSTDSGMGAKSESPVKSN